MDNEFISFRNLQYCDYYQLQPSDVKGPLNPLAAMERRYLLNKLFSVYKFTLPKHWSKAYFRYWLFLYGSIAIFYDRSAGWVMSDYGVSKQKMYYLPAVIESFNPWLGKELHGLVGVNSGIIHIMDDRRGLDDLVNEYAIKLAQIDKQINVNLMTCGTGYVYYAGSKKEGDALKMAWAKQSTGEPLVVCGGLGGKEKKKTMPDGNFLQQFNPDVAKNYIVDKLLLSRRTIMNNYLTEIGIANTNYDKKERLTNVEISENNEETMSLADIILETLNEDFEEINRISGLGLKVELRRKRRDNNAQLMGDVSVR